MILRESPKCHWEILPADTPSQSSGKRIDVEEIWSGRMYNRRRDTIRTITTKLDRFIDWFVDTRNKLATMQSYMVDTTVTRISDGAVRVTSEYIRNEIRGVQRRNEMSP